MVNIKASFDSLPLLSDTLLDRFAKLPHGHVLKFTVQRDGRMIDLSVAAERVCAGKVIVETKSGLHLQSDAENVAIGTDTISKIDNVDELALLLGHEFGHVIDGHRNLHRISAVREQEAQADRLGMALAKCAGYDVERGMQFWERYRKRPLRWLNLDPTHGSIKGRIARMRAAFPSVQCPLSRYADGTLPAEQIGYVGPTGD